MIDVAAVGQKYIGKGAPVLVEAVSLEGNLFSEDKLRRRLFRSLAVGLSLLRAVDAAETDTFRMLVVQDFEGCRRRGRRRLYLSSQ